MALQDDLLVLANDLESLSRATGDMEQRYMFLGLASRAYDAHGQYCEHLRQLSKSKAE